MRLIALIFAILVAAAVVAWMIHVHQTQSHITRTTIYKRLTQAGFREPIDHHPSKKADELQSESGRIGPPGSQESLAVYWRAIQVREAELGRDHPSLQFPLRHILDFSSQCDPAVFRCYDSAVRLLSLRKRYLGETDADTLLTLEYLVKFAGAAHRLNEAKSLAMQSVTKLEAAGMADSMQHGYVCAEIAELSSGAEVQTWYRRAKEAIDRVCLTSPASRAETEFRMLFFKEFCKLAVDAGSGPDFAAAFEQYEDLLVLTLAEDRRRKSKFIDTVCDLAETLERRGHLDQALLLFQKADQRRLTFAFHRKTRTLFGIARCLLALGKVDAALDTANKIMVSITKFGDDDRLSLIRSYALLGSVYERLGEVKRSARNYSEAYLLMESAESPGQELMEIVLGGYAQCCKRAGNNGMLAIINKKIALLNLQRQ